MFDCSVTVVFHGQLQVFRSDPRSQLNMDPRKVSELKAFIQLCDSNPAVLHLPELGFVRIWLEGCVLARTAWSAYKHLLVSCHPYMIMKGFIYLTVDINGN